MSAGSSRKALAEKLGIKPGFVVVVISPPKDYTRLLGRIPERVSIRERLNGPVNLVHAFVRTRADLDGPFARWKDAISRDGSVWVSWPKRGAKVPTDLTEDVVRAVALAHGLVDVKVCSVDETWSALKLVYRLRDRT